MYTAKGHGLVWDSEKGKPLAKFAGGIFTTESEEVANKLKELGYEVEATKKAKEKATEKG